jgi:hypothetical protein
VRPSMGLYNVVVAQNGYQAIRDPTNLFDEILTKSFGRKELLDVMAGLIR